LDALLAPKPLLPLLATPPNPAEPNVGLFIPVLPKVGCDATVLPNGEGAAGATGAGF